MIVNEQEFRNEFSDKKEDDKSKTESKSESKSESTQKTTTLKTNTKIKESSLVPTKIVSIFVDIIQNPQKPRDSYKELENLILLFFIQQLMPVEKKELISGIMRKNNYNINIKEYYLLKFYFASLLIILIIDKNFLEIRFFIKCSYKNFEKFFNNLANFTDNIFGLKNVIYASLYNIENNMGMIQIRINISNIVIKIIKICNNKLINEYIQKIYEILTAEHRRKQLPNPINGNKKKDNSFLNEDFSELISEYENNLIISNSEDNEFYKKYNEFSDLLDKNKDLAYN